MVLHVHYIISNHWQLESFFNGLFKLTTKNTKALHCWPFVRGIHQWLVDSPHKRPVMQKKVSMSWCQHFRDMQLACAIFGPTTLGSCIPSWAGQKCSSPWMIYKDFKYTVSALLSGCLKTNCYLIFNMLIINGPLWGESTGDRWCPHTKGWWCAMSWCQRVRDMRLASAIFGPAAFGSCIPSRAKQKCSSPWMIYKDFKYTVSASLSRVFEKILLLSFNMLIIDMILCENDTQFIAIM